jgi:hypothetical protein
MSASPSHQVTHGTSVLDEYNVSMALLNCHPADRAVLIDAIKRVETNNNRRFKILYILRESIAQLRLDVSYLIFDLEATRRERDAARAKLDDLP